MASATTHTSTCRKPDCRKTFTFEYRGKGGRPTLCPACRLKARRESVERYQAKRKKDGAAPVRTRANERLMKDAELNSQRAVAAALGISFGNLRKIERNVLNRIRKDPELRELWQRCRQEGMPAQEDWGDRVLDFQMELAEFYKVYEQLMGNNCEQEALECLVEIKKCQQALDKVLNPEL